MLFLLLVVFLLQSPGFEGLPIAERAGPPPPSALATHATVRSVHDIVWGCATTTFLCAWVSMDQSKSDGLARIITAIQVLWFVVQCVGRAANRLAITELELTILALASLNAYMLWLWRDKPQNIEIQVSVYYLEDIEKWEAELNEKEEERAQ